MTPKNVLSMLAVLPAPGSLALPSGARGSRTRKSFHRGRARAGSRWPTKAGARAVTILPDAHVCRSRTRPARPRPRTARHVGAEWDFTSDSPQPRLASTKRSGSRLAYLRGSALSVRGSALSVRQLRSRERHVWAITEPCAARVRGEDRPPAAETLAARSKCATGTRAAVCELRRETLAARWKRATGTRAAVCELRRATPAARWKRPTRSARRCVSCSGGRSRTLETPDGHVRRCVSCSGVHSAARSKRPTGSAVRELRRTTLAAQRSKRPTCTHVAVREQRRATPAARPNVGTQHARGGA